MISLDAQVGQCLCISFKFKQLCIVKVVQIGVLIMHIPIPAQFGLFCHSAWSYHFLNFQQKYPGPTHIMHHLYLDRDGEGG